MIGSTFGFELRMISSDKTAMFATLSGVSDLRVKSKLVSGFALPSPTQ